MVFNEKEVMSLKVDPLVKQHQMSKTGAPTFIFHESLNLFFV